MLLEKHIIQAQNEMALIMDKWDHRKPLTKILLEPNPGFMWKDQTSNKIVISPDEDLQQHIMKVWHDGITNGHLGRDETM